MEASADLAAAEDIELVASVEEVPQRVREAPRIVGARGVGLDLAATDDVSKRWSERGVCPCCALCDPSTRAYTESRHGCPEMPIDEPSTLSAHQGHGCTLKPREKKSVNQSRMHEMVNGTFIECQMRRQSKARCFLRSASESSHARKHFLRRPLNALIGIRNGLVLRGRVAGLFRVKLPWKRLALFWTLC
jgi:hypothetical protein